MLVINITISRLTQIFDNKILVLMSFELLEVLVTKCFNVSLKLEKNGNNNNTYCKKICMILPCAMHSIYFSFPRKYSFSQVIKYSDFPNVLYNF